MIDLDEARTVHRPAASVAGDGSLVTGSLQVWEATSADGRWHFRRLEEPGTPWEVVHDDFPGWAMLAPSLSKARQGAERQLHLDLTVNLPDGRGVRGGAGDREASGLRSRGREAPGPAACEPPRNLANGGTS